MVLVAVPRPSPLHCTGALRRDIHEVEQPRIIVPHIPDAGIDRISAHSLCRIRPQYHPPQLISIGLALSEPRRPFLAREDRRHAVVNSAAELDAAEEPAGEPSVA